jgi:uncharacterized protein YkwD
MTRMVRAVIAVILVLSVGSPAAPASSASAATPARGARRGHCRDTSLLPTAHNVRRVTAATLCLIERERAAHHVRALRSNSFLQRIAAGQANDMVVGDYFGDDTPTGGTPWQRIVTSHYASGARSLQAAQNIGWGTKGLSTPAAMVEGWMLSPPHREIMLTGGYRDIGVGVAPAPPPSLGDGTPGATYTVEFAARG